MTSPFQHEMKVGDKVVTNGVVVTLNEIINHREGGGPVERRVLLTIDKDYDAKPPRVSR